MKFLNSISTILLPLILVSNFAFCDTLKIYENLVQCYRNNNTITTQWIANSLQNFLEILRKIENTYPTSLDIRTFSVSLLHQLRIDGIEKAQGIQETDFVTPYRPNGIMTPKFELLLKLISNIPGNLINYDKILTTTELCTLHRFISSTVEPLKRGDEARTCLIVDKNKNWGINEYLDTSKVKTQNNRTYIIPGTISKCPIEAGTIRTLQYGTLSPGILIAAIAAGLEPQSVSIKEFFPTISTTDSYEKLETMEKYETEVQFIRKLSESLDIIDNTFAAGLAGDLAEVCMYQAPYYGKNVSVGLHGYWNDTEYPLHRYLPETYQFDWAMTDSEILAGIDAYYLSTHIRAWNNRIRRMRLSQIIEMYYSARGIPIFAIENSNRHDKGHHHQQQQQQQQEDQLRLIHTTSQLHGAPNDFSNLYRGTYYDPDRYLIGDNIDNACDRKQILNRIPKDRLKEQTYFVAKVLSYLTRTMTIEDSLLNSVCDSAVDRFFEKAQQLIDKLPDCSKIGSNYLRPEVDLILVIDGSRTKYENLKLISYLSEIIDVSCFGSNISVVHGTTGEFLVKSSNSILDVFEQLRKYDGPYPTTLSLSESLYRILDDITMQNENEKGLFFGKPKVIMIISQSQKIRDHDFKNAKRMLESSFQYFKQLYFVFLTNDVKVFEDMIQNTPDTLITSSVKRHNIINAPNIDTKTFIPQLSQILRSIPKWIRISSCDEIKSNYNSDHRKPGDPLPNSINQYVQLIEQYISPNEKLFYRINYQNLAQEIRSDLQIEFQSVDNYGDITACMTKNSKDYQCQSTNVMDPIKFNYTQKCDIQALINLQNETELCPSLMFKVDIDNSKMKCTENDCRYPDQVRFLIRLRNVECANKSTKLVISYVLFVIILISHLFCY